jgi:hypothetical protein
LAENTTDGSAAAGVVVVVGSMVVVAKIVSGGAAMVVVASAVVVGSGVVVVGSAVVVGSGVVVVGSGSGGGEVADAPDEVERTTTAPSATTSRRRWRKCWRLRRAPVFNLNRSESRILRSRPLMGRYDASRPS